MSLRRRSGLRVVTRHWSWSVCRGCHAIPALAQPSAARPSRGVLSIASGPGLRRRAPVGSLALRPCWPRLSGSWATASRSRHILRSAGREIPPCRVRSGRWRRRDQSVALSLVGLMRIGLGNAMHSDGANSALQGGTSFTPFSASRDLRGGPSPCLFAVTAIWLGLSSLTCHVVSALTYLTSRYVLWCWPSPQQEGRRRRHRARPARRGRRSSAVRRIVCCRHQTTPGPPPSS